jgi:hypothetical protein
MPSPPGRTVSRVAIHRSRQLISDSRVLIAVAKALITQARQPIACQNYGQIVCAWCQQTIGWQRVEAAERGLISHGICFTCCAQMFPELPRAPRTPSPRGSYHRTPKNRPFYAYPA